MWLNTLIKVAFNKLNGTQRRQHFQIELSENIVEKLNKDMKTTRDTVKKSNEDMKTIRDIVRSRTMI